MAIEQAPATRGREAANDLQAAARREGRKVEARKGSDLTNGRDRFEKRSKSSDGRGAGKKQDPPKR